jgi:hypothetical protein
MEDSNEIKINVSQEPKKPKYDEWEIKEAVRTLIKAEEIKQNKELMVFVAPELEKQSKAIKSAAEILYGYDRKEKTNNEKTNS